MACMSIGIPWCATTAPSRENITSSTVAPPRLAHQRASRDETHESSATHPVGCSQQKATGVTLTRISPDGWNRSRQARPAQQAERRRHDRSPAITLPGGASLPRRCGRSPSLGIVGGRPKRASRRQLTRPCRIPREAIDDERLRLMTTLFALVLGYLPCADEHGITPMAATPLCIRDEAGVNCSQQSATRMYPRALLTTPHRPNSVGGHASRWTRLPMDRSPTRHRGKVPSRLKTRRTDRGRVPPAVRGSRLRPSTTQS